MATTSCETIQVCNLPTEAVDPGDSEPPLCGHVAPYVAITDVRLEKSESDPPGRSRIVFGASGLDCPGAIPTVTGWIGDHHGNISTFYKTRLNGDVHGAHYVASVPDEECTIIHDELRTRPIVPIKRPMPIPVKCDRKARVTINVPDGEQIAFRVSQEVENHEIIIRTMIGDTFTEKEANVPLCWRQSNATSCELGTIEINVEMAATTIKKLDALADNLSRIGRGKWDILIEETTPGVRKRIQIERCPRNAIEAIEFPITE